MRIVNKRAFHEYIVLEKYEAGIQLFGHEVKSIRGGRIELGQSFAKIDGKGEAYLVNAHIPPYQNASIKGYDPARSRKLLLHKREIQGLIGKVPAHNATLVPLVVYDKHNLIKVELGLVKSKKQVDKRRLIKERDQLRRVEQELRGKE